MFFLFFGIPDFRLDDAAAATVLAFKLRIAAGVVSITDDIG